MPTRCFICGTYAKNKRYIRLVDSKYATALRIFVRLNEGTAPPATPSAPYACATCYESIRVAELEDSKVVMLPSSVGRRAGLGVFARKTLEPGDRVTSYTGLEISKTDIPKMITTSHMRKMNSTHVIDGRAGRVKFGGGLGSQINRPGPGEKPNVKIVNFFNRTTKLDTVGIRVQPRSKGGRVIPPGTELKASYGSGYKMTGVRKPRSNRGLLPRPVRPTPLTRSYKEMLAKQQGRL